MTEVWKKEDGDISKVENLISNLNGVLHGECSMIQLNRAEELYEEIKLLLHFCHVDGNEKLELRNNLMYLYKTLTEKKGRLTSNEFNEKANYLVNLIDLTTKNIEKGNFSQAGKFYSDIVDVFSNLPEGFHVKKENLQRHITQLYEKLNENVKDDKSNKANEILKLVDELSSYCCKNKSSAYTRYLFKEVTDAFVEFPEGYFDTKADVFERLVDLHNDLFGNEEVPTLEISAELAELLVRNTELKKETAYMDLFKFLREIEHFKKTKQFDKIKNKFIGANKLYHELPENKEKKSVYVYLKKLAMAVDLLTLTEKIKKADNKKEQLNELDDYSIEYSMKYPEENDFLDHIKKKQLVLNTILENKFTDGFQVRTKIEEINSLP